MSSLQAVPQLERNSRPVSVTDQDAHYGYVAYHDIALGNDYRVQPENSPYHKVLPCRQLIPFISMEVGEIDIARYGQERNVNPIKVRLKSAGECAREMEQAYAEWNFQVFRSLTGMATERAFAIFQAVQPFAYALKDVLQGLDGAEERIASEVPVMVEYDGVTEVLSPLPEADRAAAMKVLNQVRASAAHAVSLAEEKLGKTTESLVSRFSGGAGKSVPDPHDKLIAKEMGADLPSLVQQQAQQQQQQPQVQQVVQTESAEALDLKRREIELRERELAIREMELGLRPRQEAEPVVTAMAAAPASRPCAATKADGDPCKGFAITDSEFCVAHSK